MMKLPEKKITNREQLKRRISELSAQMEEKELQLQSDLKQVHDSLHASNIVRNAIKDLREQSELRVGLAKVAADIGAHTIIDSIMFRMKHGILNSFVSIVLKKIADHFILRDRNKLTN